MSKDKTINIKLALEGGEEVNVKLQATEENLKALGGAAEEITKRTKPPIDGLNTDLINFTQRIAAVQASAQLLQATFGETVRAYDNLIQSQSRLSAASKLAGIDLDELQGIALQSQESFGFSERQANDFTIALAKLTAKAGDTSKTADAIGALLNVAAAQGLNAEQALQAINQAILGIDEGTDKLFQKNPSVIYKEYADAIGTTVGKLTDQQKAQALLAATMDASSKVGNTYNDFLGTGAGQQAQFNATLEEFQARTGGLIRETLGPLVSTATNILEVFGTLPEPLQRTVIALGSVVIVSKLLEKQGLNMAVNFASLRTVFTSLPGPAGVATLSLSGISAALGVAAKAAQTFLASIGPAGWLFLGVSLVPMLLDGAKSLFAFGDEASASKEKTEAFSASVAGLQSEISRLRPEELEERLRNVRAGMSVLQGLIRETGSKPFLSPENQQILDSNVEAFTRLVSEASLLEAQLKKVKTAVPGSAEFKGLAEQIKDIKERLEEIANKAVDGVIPPAELKKAQELKSLLDDLVKKQEKALQAVGLKVDVKPVIEKKTLSEQIKAVRDELAKIADSAVNGIIPPADLERAEALKKTLAELTANQEKAQIAVGLKLPDKKEIAETAASLDDFRTQLVTGFYSDLGTVNAALQILQERFNAAKTTEARAEIQALMDQFKLLQAQMSEGVDPATINAHLAAVENAAEGTVAAMRAALPQIEALLASNTITDKQRQFLEGFKKTFEDTISETERFNSAATALFQGTVVNTISSFAEAAGEALATGDTKGMMMAFLTPIADGLSQFGRMLIQAGIAKIAFFKALAGGPVTAGAAIAAGVALMAVAGAIKSHLQKMAAKEEKKDEAAQSPAPAPSRGFASGGIQKTRAIVEVAEEGAEMILSAPATARLAPFFPMLNKGILPALNIPVPVNMAQSASNPVSIQVGGRFQLRGRDLVAVWRDEIALEKATGMS